MKIPFTDIEILVITKRGRVAADIRMRCKTTAIKNYMFRYNCGLRESYDYITKVEEELHRVKGNQVQNAATDKLHESQKSKVWLWEHHPFNRK